MIFQTLLSLEDRRRSGDVASGRVERSMASSPERYPFTPLRGVTERDLLCFGGE